MITLGELKQSHDLLVETVLTQRRLSYGDKDTFDYLTNVLTAAFAFIQNEKVREQVARSPGLEYLDLGYRVFDILNVPKPPVHWDEILKAYKAQYGEIDDKTLDSIRNGLQRMVEKLRIARVQRAQGNWVGYQVRGRTTATDAADRVDLEIDRAEANEFGHVEIDDLTRDQCLNLLTTCGVPISDPERFSVEALQREVRKFLRAGVIKHRDMPSLA